ncbi:MAG: metal-dependent hydrolase [Myxococcota bacterium]
MTERKTLIPRKLHVEFDSATPRRWFGGDGFRTHWLNAYSILVPDGEKFIHRTVAAVSDQVSDPELKAQIDGFSRQELSHAGQHQRAFRVLDRQGFRYRSVVAGFRWLNYSVVEPMVGRKLSLSVAAGIEHFNAMFAEVGLENDDYFDGADPALATLLRWHFAEEIEHKAVVHDVLADVAPGYVLRVFGGLLAFALFALDVALVSCWLAVQDGSLFRPSAWVSWFRYWFTRERFAWRMLKGALTYMRPGFHPNDHDNYHLVDRVATQGEPPALTVAA